MIPQRVFVGIDVSKARLDIAVCPRGDEWIEANNDTGIERAMARLKRLAPELVVLETTSPLQMPLRGALAAAQLPVAIVSSRQVWDFSKATGIWIEADVVHSQVLARFAEKLQSKALAGILARRLQVVKMLTDENKRLRRAPEDRRKQISEPVRKQIRAHIQLLMVELAGISEDLLRLEEAPPEGSRITS